METVYSYLFENKLDNQILAGTDDTRECIIKLSDQIPLRILIVDDSNLNLKLLSVQFGLHGYKVDMASNGRIACEMAFENDYDLICMDINMPVLNGLDSSKRIMEHKKRKPPYIVALSSCNFETIKEELDESGIADFFPKPLTINKIHQLILTTASFAKAS